MSDPLSPDSAIPTAAAPAAIGDADHQAPDSAIEAAAAPAATPPADQVPLPGMSGHEARRDPGHHARRTSGSGLSGHVAVDFGAYLWVSEDGDSPTSPWKVTGHGGKLRNAKGEDFVRCVSVYFGRGCDVVTEPSTPRSFGMRGRMDELLAVLARNPERTLWTIGPHAVSNWFRRAGLDYDPSKDNDQAAAAIYQIAATRSVKRWRPPNPEEAITRTDPLRPNLSGLIQLRNDGYPVARWGRQVGDFLPHYHELTAEQRKILCNGRDWARDRCAALVFSLREPSSRSRQGWERVLGASAHGRPNLYRQMLSAGKPDQKRLAGTHFTGIRYQDATRALRGLRTMILAAHPKLMEEVS